MAQNIAPKTKKIEHFDVYHSQSIADPYHWLEDDNAIETKKWVDMQNSYTQLQLKKIHFRDKIHEDLSSMWNYTKYSGAFKKGDYTFFYKNDGLQNQPVLYYQKGAKGVLKVFIDPNKLSKEGTTSLGSMGFSKNQKYCAYAVSQAGSDWQTIYIKDVENGNLLSDSISYVKFSGMSWIGEDGFYYSGYEKPKNESEKFSMKTENQKIFYHKLGTNSSQDRVIYEDPTHPLRYKGVSVSENEQYLILYLSEGTDGSEIAFVDLNKKPKPSTNDFITLLPGFKYNYEIIEVVDHRFMVYTNDGADNYQLLSINPKNANDRKTIIPAKEQKLDAVSFVGNKFICSYLKDASTLLSVYNSNGTWESNISLPGIGTASGFSGSVNDKVTFYTYASFNTPPTIYHYDIETGESNLYLQPELPFNTNDIVVRQEFFTSQDGTQIPMFIMHRKDANLDSKPNLPLLMYGYGGFNISLTPSFKIENLYFVQQGGVYVMVNLRGGSEYGEYWHSQGMLENKQNVFNDFISAAEYLIAKGITSKEKIAISGRSNGGLLVGACMTQRPDLFKVALPGVGVLDMLRYQKFTVGWGWVVEYGSSDNEKDFNYLIKYSPLHNLKKGTQYPCTLITTADHDDRVVPAHSFKFAAALQEANNGQNPCLIRIDKQAGHGAGKPVSKVIDEWADILSFTMYHLDMDLNK